MRISRSFPLVRLSFLEQGVEHGAHSHSHGRASSHAYETILDNVALHPFQQRTGLPGIGVVLDLSEGERRLIVRAHAKISSNRPLTPVQRSIYYNSLAKMCAFVYPCNHYTSCPATQLNPSYLQQRLQCGPGIQIVAASVLPDSKEVLKVSLLALVHRQQGAQDFQAPINVGSLLGVDQRPCQPAGVWCGQRLERQEH